MTFSITILKYKHHIINMVKETSVEVIPILAIIFGAYLLYLSNSAGWLFVISGIVILILNKPTKRRRK